MTGRGRAGAGRTRLLIAAAVLSLGPLGAMTPSALARRHAAAAPAQDAAPAQAAQLVQQGVMALAMRDFAAAYKALSAAYRLQPSADTLYQLGVVAQSSGDSASAQDLLRRYLAEVGTQGDAARRAEAQRIATRPRTASGEVSVLGPLGAFVLLDERLVGRLPLPRPLLVAAGAHVLTLDRAGVLSPGRIEVKGGQGLEARLTEDGTALQVRRLPTVFVASAAALSARAQEVVDGALTAAGLSIFDAAAQNGALPPTECASERACLLRWAAAQGVAFALELTAQATPCEVRASLLDVAIAEAASQRTASCGAGDAEETARVLGELLPPLLNQGIARPRGTLRVSSQPPGAEVLVGERSLGKTPLERPSFAAPLELSLQLPGFRTEQRRITVSADAATEVQVALAVMPAQVAPVMVWERRRPRWRIALGITALAVGAGLAGFGIPALAINGSCVSDPTPPILTCERRFDTATAGVGLVVSGGVLLALGATAVALPGPRRQVEAPAPRREKTAITTAANSLGAPF